MPDSNTLGPITDDGAQYAEEIGIFKNFLGAPDTSIPISSNFVIRFNDFPTALTNGNFISSFESNWSIANATKTLTDLQSPYGSCLFANGFVPPIESVDVERVGMASDFSDHSGGLLSGVVSKSRQQQPVLSISFLETNKSFIDFVIRPWVTLVSFRGLIARKDDPIKTTIDAVFFDSTSPDSLVRKYFRFNDCAPVSIAAGTAAAYGSTIINVIDTSWVFSTYDIIDSDGATA